MRSLNYGSENPLQKYKFMIQKQKGDRGKETIQARRNYGAKERKQELDKYKQSI